MVNITNYHIHLMNIPGLIDDESPVHAIPNINITKWGFHSNAAEDRTNIF